MSYGWSWFYYRLRMKRRLRLPRRSTPKRWPLTRHQNDQDASWPSFVHELSSVIWNRWHYCNVLPIELELRFFGMAAKAHLYEWQLGLYGFVDCRSTIFTAENYPRFPFRRWSVAQILSDAVCGRQRSGQSCVTVSRTMRQLHLEGTTKLTRCKQNISQYWFRPKVDLVHDM